jgi:hypothetical protein
MLASNFRFSTEDVDVSKLEQPWPEWLRRIVDKLAAANGWQPDWFNDGVASHLSALAKLAATTWNSAASPAAILRDWSCICRVRNICLRSS